MRANETPRKRAAPALLLGISELALWPVGDKLRVLVELVVVLAVVDKDEEEALIEVEVTEVEDNDWLLEVLLGEVSRLTSPRMHWTFCLSPLAFSLTHFSKSPRPLDDLHMLLKLYCLSTPWNWLQQSLRAWSFEAAQTHSSVYTDSSQPRAGAM